MPVPPRSAPVFAAMILLALATACARSVEGPLPTITASDIRARLAADRDRGRVAVVHYWATWCGPCLEEFPSLARFHRDELASARDIDFFAVAVEETAPEETRRYVRAQGARFPVFLAEAPDPNAFVAAVEARWRGALPSTFVYGRDGALAYSYIGEVDDLATFRRRLSSL